MKANGWKDAEVKELATFFVKLDLHPICLQEYRSQIVLWYQDRVQHSWVTSIQNRTLFRIGSINDGLMDQYQKQIGMEILAKNNVSQYTQWP